MAISGCSSWYLPIIDRIPQTINYLAKGRLRHTVLHRGSPLFILNISLGDEVKEVPDLSWAPTHVGPLWCNPEASPVTLETESPVENINIKINDIKGWVNDGRDDNGVGDFQLALACPDSWLVLCMSFPFSIWHAPPPSCHAWTPAYALPPP